MEFQSWHQNFHGISVLDQISMRGSKFHWKIGPRTIFPWKVGPENQFFGGTNFWGDQYSSDMPISNCRKLAARVELAENHCSYKWTLVFETPGERERVKLSHPCFQLWSKMAHKTLQVGTSYSLSVPRWNQHTHTWLCDYGNRKQHKQNRQKTVHTRTDHKHNTIEGQPEKHNTIANNLKTGMLPVTTASCWWQHHMEEQ